MVCPTTSSPSISESIPTRAWISTSSSRSPKIHPNDPWLHNCLGNSLPDIRRIVKGLEAYPVAGVDLNVGCPAPKIYKNHAGGGLLRNLDLLDSILGTLRDSIKVGTFSVKIRIGFDSFEPFERTIELVRKHGADLLTIHARTVAESYRGEPHYEFIQQAAKELDCPVYANGNITSAAKAKHVMETTGCAGVMIGRSAIRNPWIFRQTREVFNRPNRLSTNPRRCLRLHPGSV